MRMARNIAGIGALSSLSLLAACGDPVPPAAQAAVSIHVQPYDDTDPVYGQRRCPPDRHWASVPFQRDRQPTSQTQQTTDNESGPKAVHNQDGNSVTCSVKPNGNGFRVTGSATAYAEYQGRKLKPSTVHIGIGSIGEGDSNARGTLTIQNDATLNTYSSEDCSYSVQGGSLEVAPGRIWAKVTCQGLTDPGAPDSACQVDTGFFIFENCAQ